MYISSMRMFFDCRDNSCFIPLSLLLWLVLLCSLYYTRFITWPNLHTYLFLTNATIISPDIPDPGIPHLPNSCISWQSTYWSPWDVSCLRTPGGTGNWTTDSGVHRQLLEELSHCCTKFGVSSPNPSPDQSHVYTPAPYETSVQVYVYHPSTFTLLPHMLPIVSVAILSFPNPKKRRKNNSLKGLYYAFSYL